MKDIVIGQARIKRELLVLSTCFVAAVLINVYAIATRGTEWSELLSQLHITLAVAVFFYVVLEGKSRLLRRITQQARSGRGPSDRRSSTTAPIRHHRHVERTEEPLYRMPAPAQGVPIELPEQKP